MSGVKGKSGRKPKSYHRQQTTLIIAETSPKAALYLKNVVIGDVKPESAIIDTCKFIINQDIGSPTQKTILSGDKDNPLQPFVFILPGGKTVTAKELSNADSGKT